MKENVKIKNCLFAFKCPRLWDELEITANPDIKYCNVCDRGVYLAKDEHAFRVLAEYGKCVALEETRDAGVIMTLGMAEVVEKVNFISHYLDDDDQTTKSRIAGR